MAKPGWAFALHGAGTTTIEIDIFDIIGEGLFFEGVTARQVLNTLKENPKAEHIRVRINSKGGDVVDGLAIHNLLAEHSAKVSVAVVGLAASMASLIAMAGDEIQMAGPSFMMIHNPRMGLMGDADTLREKADLLDKMRDTFVDIFAGRTGLPRAELVKMLKAETWMNASEAKAKGFADKVTKLTSKTNKKAAAMAFAALQPEDYANLPDELRQLATAQTTLTLPSGQVDDQDPPSNDKDPKLMTLPIAILAALGLSEGVNEATTVAAINTLKTGAATAARALGTLETAIGETGEGAIGTIAAWKLSHEKLPAAEAALKETKDASAATDLTALLKEGRDSKKLSKAEADNIKAQVEAKEMTLTAAKAMIGCMTPKPHLTADPEPSAVNALAPLGAVPKTHNGKAFEEMAPKEWVALATQSPELYETLRNDAIARGAA